MTLVVGVHLRKALEVIFLNKVKPLLVTLGGLPWQKTWGRVIACSLAVFSALSFWYFFDKKKVHVGTVCHVMLNIYNVMSKVQLDSFFKKIITPSEKEVFR